VADDDGVGQSHGSILPDEYTHAIPTGVADDGVVPEYGGGLPNVNSCTSGSLVMSNGIVVRFCVIITDVYASSTTADLVIQNEIARNDGGGSDVYPNPTSIAALIITNHVSHKGCLCAAQVESTPVRTRIVLEQIVLNLGLCPHQIHPPSK
jgi:hypothetical protein